MSKKRTVLIVEDSKTTQIVIKFMLDKHGYEVVAQADNGVDGVEKYKKLKPDIILMDLAMPKKDGLTAIKEIIEFDNNAKIIAVSALYNPKVREDALKAGAISYIVKPFEVSEFIRVIEECFQ